MAVPSRTTIKRLFALSRNKCAFPNCSERISDENGTIIGRICHIEADKTGGPRYNPAQSEDERQSFENLVIMCANHHIVIDENPEYYTVSKLKEIKYNHEQKSANYEEPPDVIVDKLLRTINVTGPVVFSQGQMGGQTAYHIDNYGLRPREITHAAGAALISRLQKYPCEKFLIDYVGGDYEVLDLAESLDQVLIDAKWESIGMAENNRRPPLVRWGIRLLFPEVRPSFQCFLEWLDGNGFEIDPYVTNSKFDHLTIQIGKNR